MSRVAFKVPLKILDAAWQRPGVREENLNPVIPLIEILLILSNALKKRSGEKKRQQRRAALHQGPSARLEGLVSV